MEGNMKRTKQSKPQGVPLYLDVHAVAARYGVTCATIWSWLDAGMPQPIRFSYGTSRWAIEDLNEWDAEKRAERAPRCEWTKEQKRRKRQREAEA